MKDLIKKIEKTICRYHMLPHGSRVLVAVSGGPDSVVLLDVLDRLKAAFSLDLVVAHFDHALRPRDDDGETRFVASLAASMGLPFVTEKSKSHFHTKGMSLEEAARDLRYEFLYGAKAAQGAQKIALGHTLNDQAETVIMRLLRGSGPAGLSGIPPVRNHDIIRPLIEVTRGEIEAYIARHNLRYVTDSSNLEKHHLRNKIRLELLPQLEDYQPRIVEILGQTAEILGEENRWMEREADRWIDLHIKPHQTDGCGVSLKSLKELASALQNRVLRQIIRRIQGGLRRVQLCHIEAIKGLLKGRPQAQLNLPNGILVKRIYDTILFVKRSNSLENQEENGFHAIVNGTGIFKLGALPAEMAIEELKMEDVPTVKNASQWIAHLDGDRITYPLMMRCFTPGDRFVPLGMTGHKKLKDFFVDQKIPIHVRKRIPLLCRGEDLVWVCGLRLDERFKVRPETKKVIRISLALSPGPLRDFFLNSSVTRS
ncbi:MAG: tRNA lysidine(34) synthetase TilS [Deltaproteobacteria bacterium]|nr:tRNA lysidine(34) synthetase TilS [Deltaproteobacteria bacterium]